jgi:hypothetical protein
MNLTDKIITCFEVSKSPIQSTVVTVLYHKLHASNTSYVAHINQLLLHYLALAYWSL